MPVSVDEYRRVMGHFATGVAIVTTVHEGRIGGMTANAITSVSLDPMLLLFCADKRTRTHDMIDRSGVFAVNILTQEMRELSQIFAENGRPEEDRFNGVKYVTGKMGAPLLEENMGWIECRVAYRYAGGDHTIFVGEVVNASEQAGSPLIYYRGGYNALRQQDGSRDQPCSRRGVLLTHDLIFSTKVTSTARALGLEVTAAADLVRAAELCRDQRPGCVFIDLGVPNLNITAAVAQLRSAAGAVPTVAYGSHVDKARLDVACAAGCDEMLPRSRFSAELPALLRRYLDTAERGERGERDNG